jgi:hypothetical protein
MSIPVAGCIEGGGVSIMPVAGKSGGDKGNVCIFPLLGSCCRNAGEVRREMWRRRRRRARRPPPPGARCVRRARAEEINADPG